MYLWETYVRLAPLTSDSDLRHVSNGSMSDLIEVERSGMVLKSLSGRCPVLEFHLGEIGISFDVYAPDVETAASQSKTLVDDALIEAGLAPMRIVRLEVSDKDAGHRDDADQPHPLMGVAELARFLGVKKQRITQLRKTRKFPMPVEELSMGPVWLRSHILEWQRRRNQPV